MSLHKVALSVQLGSLLILMGIVPPPPPSFIIFVKLHDFDFTCLFPSVTLFNII